MHTINEYINIFVTLLAIIDPLGAIPFFIGLMGSESEKVQSKTAWMIAITMGAVLIGTALFGEILLSFFGISIGSFRVAGGVLLFLIGISMLHGRKLLGGKFSGESAAIIPMAIPLLSGPGAISSMTIYAHHYRSGLHIGMLIGISLLLALITGITLRAAQPIARWLGKTGLNITVRLMGLLLSAAAVQFIADGVGQLFPILLRH